MLLRAEAYPVPVRKEGIADRAAGRSELEVDLGWALGNQFAMFLEQILQLLLVVGDRCLEQMDPELAIDDRLLLGGELGDHLIELGGIRLWLCDLENGQWLFRRRSVSDRSLEAPSGGPLSELAFWR